jgi:hypothetical protein
VPGCGRGPPPAGAGLQLGPNRSPGGLVGPQARCPGGGAAASQGYLLSLIISRVRYDIASTGLLQGQLSRFIAVLQLGGLVGRQLPAPAPPCVFVRQRFSAPAHAHATRGSQIGCGGLPAHSIPPFLHCRSPSGPLLLLQDAPFSCVQRTGCIACGLGYPHQVLVGSPHVHSSRLVPVRFAGFLIKCLHFIGMSWAFAQVRPPVTLRGRLRAVLGYASRPWGCQPR